MAAARASITAAIARPVASRAISIRIEPRTLNLRESRAILRALKRYGDVDSFQDLQHDPVDPAPHRIHAVFRAERAAERFMADCPLTVTADPPPPPRPVASPASFQLPYLVAAEQAKRQQTQHAPPEGRAFTLSPQRSVTDHVAGVQQRLQYWGYSAPMNSFAAEALADRVPVDGYTVLATPGKTVPARLVRNRLEAAAERKTAAETMQAREAKARRAEAKQAEDGV